MKLRYKIANSLMVTLVLATVSLALDFIASIYSGLLIVRQGLTV